MKRGSPRTANQAMLAARRTARKKVRCRRLISLRRPAHLSSRLCQPSPLQRLPRLSMQQAFPRLPAELASRTATRHGAGGIAFAVAQAHRSRPKQRLSVGDLRGGCFGTGKATRHSHHGDVAEPPEQLHAIDGRELTESGGLQGQVRFFVSSYRF